MRFWKWRVWNAKIHKMPYYVYHASVFTLKVIKIPYINFNYKH